MTVNKYTYKIESDNPNFHDSRLSVLATSRKDADRQIDALAYEMQITHAEHIRTKQTNHQPKLN